MDSQLKQSGSAMQAPAWQVQVPEFNFQYPKQNKQK